MKLLTTIRGRLGAGFGVTLALILAAGLLAGYGLVHAGSRNGFEVMYSSAEP